MQDMTSQPTTLPDILRPGLNLVFVGINPGSFSAKKGHYYARTGNLFWWALYESGLVARRLGPADDTAMPDQGMGFTDVVKRPSNSAAELTDEEFRSGAEELIGRLRKCSPLVVCFNGLTGYRHCFGERGQPGPQEKTIGASRVYVVPSTSRRNAHYQQDQILHWFRGLKACLVDVKEKKEVSR